MGIKDLQKVIQTHAPHAVRTRQTKDYLNKKVAIDASILLYQFITTITTADGESLKNQQGQVTSHLIGLLARCTRMVEAGVKPIFVFDGTAFSQKAGELEKRKALKQENELKATEAKLQNNMEDYKKYAKRSVRVGVEQYAQAVKLLQFLGICCIVAEGEAEALCVALCRAGLVDAVASSDLDCVAYGAPIFIRNLATDKDVIEIGYEAVLKEMDMSQEQFVDLCILLGCDYLDTIPSVGPKTAHTLIKQHNTIEAVLESSSKYKVEADYLEKVKGARKIFMSENQLTEEQTKKYKEVIGSKVQLDVDGGVRFLVDEMQFDENNARVKFEKFKKLKSAPKQMTLTSFIKKAQ